MKHKMSYPRGKFKRLYGRDVNTTGPVGPSGTRSP